MLFIDLYFIFNGLNTSWIGEFQDNLNIKSQNSGSVSPY